ncbi:MAG TPA: WD40 repeat domain-containing protein [Thermoanaerobaculia bacterium]|nr:WD40 repeat domain-containing protein [Thermoanaerobaculia bacterium]
MPEPSQPSQPSRIADLQRQALTPDNPWPGLEPFDEADREFFHGRATETSELLRLARREPLTVLFGRSGLGKTSLLKAGLFPLLRDEDCLPVYVRLDHSARAPELREQIFHALREACDADRVQAAQPAAHASLWSFFHRRDAEFWSARNRPVTPVIFFDQFEEIFTLGQETEESRARSAAFLAELSDLIENRTPGAVREALEAEPTAARQFDFKRSTVKLVLSFREDFLAEMEGLKEGTPSLMYNRFRLLAMNGTQAYEVITRAGGTLVDDDVARRMIRLAWKNEPSPPVEPADFPKIEIDPALLSVVCSELNHKRQQTEPPLARITPELLAGADREILSGFYERGMAGLDPRVRTFVEDELITGRGYRDSRALEDALALPGVTAEALDALVRRRLLRIDERQSVRRLELTHDVLARVVKESRDSRRDREARALQRRNRRNAALVLAGAIVVLILIAWAGWFLRQAAQVLQEAEITRLMARADHLQDLSYDASLLVNLEAVRAAPALLDTQSGLLRRFVSHPQLSGFLPGHKDWVTKVVFSPDGTRLASASRDHTVVLWDVASRQPLATLAGHQGAVLSVAFSPDGTRLASASEDKTVILWDVSNVQDINSRKPLATFAGHKGEVSGVAFSPDGKRLASASEDQTVILWDVDSHQRLATLEGHTAKVRGVAFSPDGKRLASAGDDRAVILWDVDSRQRLATLESHMGKVASVAFSPDGKRLASASEDQIVILWDENHKPQARLKGHKGPVYSVAFSPDGKQLASASEDQTVILWDVDDNKRLTTLAGHKDQVRGVAFSPDSKLLASASRDKTVILWNVSDVDSRKPLATLEHQDVVLGVAFSPDGKRLAAASADKTVTLWNVLDIASGKPLATLRGHQDGVLGVAFTPDGKRLASASDDQTIMLWNVWDIDSGKPLATLKGHQDSVLGVAFSPDGKRLASASADKTVILWDVDSQKPLATLKGHTDKVYSVAFSPDGKRLASASADNTVILWDMDSRKRLVTLEGHRDRASGVAFSPDGQRLASASWDNTVILWDVDSHQQLATLEGHDNKVSGVAFSPDGQHLASASQDKTVILWDVGLNGLAAEACRTAHRNLTCPEWRNYLGADKPYHKTCEALPGPERCE